MSSNNQANIEIKPDAQPGPKKEKKSKPAASGVQLPFLVELTCTVSTLILVFLAFAVMIASFFAGASLLNTVLRTGVAVSVVGALLMLVSSQISAGLLFAMRIEQEEAEKQMPETSEQKTRHSLLDEEQKLEV